MDGSSVGSSMEGTPHHLSPQGNISSPPQESITPSTSPQPPQDHPLRPLVAPSLQESLSLDNEPFSLTTLSGEVIDEVILSPPSPPSPVILQSTLVQEARTHQAASHDTATIVPQGSSSTPVLSDQASCPPPNTSSPSGLQGRGSKVPEVVTISLSPILPLPPPSPSHITALDPQKPPLPLCAPAFKKSNAKKAKKSTSLTLLAQEGLGISCPPSASLLPKLSKKTKKATVKALKEEMEGKAMSQSEIPSPSVTIPDRDDAAVVTMDQAPKSSSIIAHVPPTTASAHPPPLDQQDTAPEKKVKKRSRRGGKKIRAKAERKAAREAAAAASASATTAPLNDGSLNRILDSEGTIPSMYPPSSEASPSQSNPKVQPSNAKKQKTKKNITAPPNEPSLKSQGTKGGSAQPNGSKLSTLASKDQESGSSSKTSPKKMKRSKKYKAKGGFFRVIPLMVRIRHFVRDNQTTCLSFYSLQENQSQALDILSKAYFLHYTFHYDTKGKL